MKKLSNIFALFVVNAIEQKAQHIEMQKNGWFPSTFTLRSKKKDDETIDEFMLRCIKKDNFLQIKEYLIGLHPSRKRHFEAAFNLMANNEYIGAIPLLLLLLDGLPLDRGFGLVFQGKRNSSGNHGLDILKFFESLIKHMNSDNKFQNNVLIRYYSTFIAEAENFIISKNTENKHNESLFTLNRHGIMHGRTEYLNYDEEINALKIISMMLFVTSILHVIDFNRNTLNRQ